MAFKGSKTKKAETAQAEAVVTAVRGLKTPEVMAGLAQAQVEVQKTFASITSQVTGKMSILDDVNKAIEIGEARLKEVHNIEAAAISLDDLEAEILQIRDGWQRDQAAHATEIAEQDRERAKQRQREDAEYTYKIQQERQKATDDFVAAVARQKRDEQLRQETLVRGWDDRGRTLTAAEKELTDLRSQVAGIPELIKNATQREVAIVSNSMKRDHSQALQIVQITAENDQKIAASTISNLTKQYDQAMGTVSALQAELRAANARTEAIAGKAVEASSGRQALEAVQRATENQSTQPSKGGR